MGFPGGTSGKEPTSDAGDIRDSPALLPGNPMRSLVGYSPWSFKKSDTTE